MNVAIDADSARTASARSARPRIHLIWTRDIDANLAFGRLKLARSIRSALQQQFETDESQLRSLAEAKSLGSMIRAMAFYAVQCLRMRPLPLQCLLFADPREADRVISEIAPDAVAAYVDGVRCFTLLRRLRRLRPDLSIVTDLDDLMSRRMELLLELGEAPSTGYMKRSLPPFVERLLQSQFFARTLLRYEMATLRGIEADVVLASDRSVLVSREDARVLAEQAGDREKVVGIAPATPIVRAPAPLAPGQIRFVFVGSDTLRQNQLTIDRLIALWRAHRLTAPLVIYGEQIRRLELPDHVSMPGYAKTIEEIYDGRSVLVSPSYLAGGIKTKVLEAFGYGTAVVGNAVTFEAMDIDDYPLVLGSDDELVQLLRDPESHRDRFYQAALVGAEMVRTHNDPQHIIDSWGDLFRSVIQQPKGQRR